MLKHKTNNRNTIILFNYNQQCAPFINNKQAKNDNKMFPIRIIPWVKSHKKSYIQRCEYFAQMPRVFSTVH